MSAAGAGTLYKILAFFRRDLSIARSYRAAFLLEIVDALFLVASFYYLSRFVESPQLSQSLPQGGDYFSFALIGIAFLDYLNVSLNAFDSSLEEARQNKTLEGLLVTQTPLPVILAGSAVYPFTLMALRTLIYIGWGIALFHFKIHSVNWAGAVAVMVASVFAFVGMGVLSATYVLMFKRGNPVKWLVLGISGLLCGTMYPVTVLPHSLQLVARLIPFTYSLQGLRAAILGGASFRQLLPSLAALLLFAAILLPLSFAVFAWALRRTKVTGTLTHL